MFPVTVAKLAERFEELSQYHWEEHFAAKADELPETAARHMAKFERYTRAVRYLRERLRNPDLWPCTLVTA